MCPMHRKPSFERPVKLLKVWNGVDGRSGIAIDGA